MAQNRLSDQKNVINNLLKEEQILLQNTRRFVSKLPAPYECKKSSRNEHLLSIKKMSKNLEGLISSLNSEISPEKLETAFEGLIKVKLTHKMLKGGLGMAE